MKIIINSNINYKKALYVNLKSLLSTGFDRFNDIVLVISQSTHDEGPKKININKFISDTPSFEICVIQMKMNNFDYCGYHALNIYKNDDLVYDNSYLYILDTCTYDNDFLNKYLKLNIKKSTVVTCYHPHSNICAFDKDVVDSYGDNFRVPLTKREAIHLECGELIKNEKLIRGITSFGTFESIGPRIMMENLDIYDTGHARVRAHYPYFGVNKWILWAKNGDMTGNVVPN
jgi:hypothetical protein